MSHIRTNQERIRHQRPNVHARLAPKPIDRRDTFHKPRQQATFCALIRDGADFFVVEQADGTDVGSFVGGR